MRPRTAIAASLVVLAASAVTTAHARESSKVSTNWPAASSVLRGSGVTVHGRVSGGDRRVVLQHRTNSGWQRLRRVTASDTGRYRMRIPTRWTTTHKLRIRVPATATHGAVTSRSRKRLTVRPAYSPKGAPRDHNLMKWRFDPCRTIRYKVHKRRMPRGGFKDLQRALHLVEIATGLNFRYVGGTRQVPFRGLGGSRGLQTTKVWGADLLFGWATPRQVPALRGRTIGRGGPTASARVDPDRRGFIRTADAMVAIDSTYRARRGFGGGYTRGELYLHEIGHALGVHHASTRTQVMAQAVALQRDRWGRGDLTGLRKVGRSAGCFPRATSRSTVSHQPPQPLE